MNDHDNFDRQIATWLAEGPHRLPETAVDRIVGDIEQSDTRKLTWLPRRETMHRFVTAAATAAAVVLVAVIGIGVLGGGGLFGPGATPKPTVAPPSPSPSPALLARGNFVYLRGGRLAVELEATGESSNVTGVMTGSGDGGNFTVDLKCTRTTEDGLILIGGDTTDSTTHLTYEGTRAGIILKRGTPVQANFWFQRDDTRAASCLAFLEDRLIGLRTGTIDGRPIDLAKVLEPIEGTVELGP